MCTVPLELKLNPDERKFNKKAMETKFSCKNDDARSMTLCDAPQGTTITVYDDGKMKETDDSATITVEGDLNGCEKIPSFEPEDGLEPDTWTGDRWTWNIRNVKITYCCGGNLDGKVSSLYYRHINVDNSNYKH